MGAPDLIRNREVLGIIADNLSKAGWSWGRVSAIDSKGRTIWIAAAHGDDGKRFVVHANEVDCVRRTRISNPAVSRNPRNLRFNDFSVSAKK